MMYHLLAFMSDKYYLLLHMKYRDINGKFVMLLLDEVSFVGIYVRDKIFSFAIYVLLRYKLFL